MKVLFALFALSMPSYCAPAATPVPPVDRCPAYETLLATYQPKGGWDVARMSGYMYRESKCTPVIRSRSNDSGLLQINDINHSYLRTHLGEWVDANTLMDPTQNVRAAVELCNFWRAYGKSCYRPWGGTG